MPLNRPSDPGKRRARWRIRKRCCVPLASFDVRKLLTPRAFAEFQHRHEFFNVFFFYFFSRARFVYLRHCAIWDSRFIIRISRMRLSFEFFLFNLFLSLFIYFKSKTKNITKIKKTFNLLFFNNFFQDDFLIFKYILESLVVNVVE